MIKHVLTYLTITILTLSADPIKVLIVDGFNNHNWKDATTTLTTFLEGTNEFTVSASTVPPLNSEAWKEWNPTFSDYDVVIQNTNDITVEGKWTESAKQGLKSFLAEGGGMFVFHSANNAFPNWDEYNKMIGLGWRKKNFGPSVKIEDNKVVKIPKGKGSNTGHGKKVDITVYKFGNHPIHTEMGDSWEAKNLEVYRFPRGPAENLTILSYAKDEKTGFNFPIEWCTNYGKGRVYASTYGHYWPSDEELPAGMKCPAFQKILPTAMKWLANKGTEEE